MGAGDQAVPRNQRNQEPSGTYQCKGGGRRSVDVVAFHFRVFQLPPSLPHPSCPPPEGPLSILSPTAPPGLQIPGCPVMFSQPLTEAPCPGLHPALGSHPQMAADSSQVIQVSTEGGWGPSGRGCRGLDNFWSIPIEQLPMLWVTDANETGHYKGTRGSGSSRKTRFYLKSHCV